jgi:hypothetical protein
MDAAFIINYIKKLNNKPTIKDGRIEEFTVSMDQFSSFGSLFSILIGLYAAFLSYSCNSRHNMSESSKIIWAIIAYFFGLIYLVYYALFRSDHCEGY